MRKVRSPQDLLKIKYNNRGNKSFSLAKLILAQFTGICSNKITPCLLHTYILNTLYSRLLSEATKQKPHSDF